MTKHFSIAALVSLSCAGCSESRAPAAPLTAPAAPSAAEAAAQMDPRTPVPLLPMMAQHQKQQMRDHLAAVGEIIDGMAKSDFGAVETASRKIGYSDSMARMCTHMGAGAPGFTPATITFHKTADTIGAAAAKKDRAGVLAALDATLKLCVSCHSAYKQQIVDEATWTRLSHP